MTTTDLIPAPGADLVPDGWWQSTVVPWADRQTDHLDIATAAAQIAGLIEAYDTLGADTLELTKARRYLELRWGEMLGPTEERQRTDLDPRLSLTSDSSLAKDTRYRFRKLALGRVQIVDLLERAQDPDEITRAACIRAAKPQTAKANAKDAAGMVAGMVIDEPIPTIDHGTGSWTDAHDRQARKIEGQLQTSLQQLGDACSASLSSHARSDLLRGAEVRARQAAGALGALAFQFE